MEVNGPMSGQTLMVASDLRPVQALLTNWTLESWLSRKPPSAVITVSDESTVERALKLFATRSITAAPVMDGESGDFLGFLDLADVLKAVLSWFNVRDLSDVDRHERLRRAGDKLRTAQVRDICTGHDGQLVYKANTNSTLSEVIVDGFLHPADGGERCHRVGVFEYCARESSLFGVGGGGAGAHSKLPAVRIISIVTQTDLIRFLDQHVDEFPDLACKSLADLGLARKPVVCVAGDMPTINVFATAYANRVSSVGVVDRCGHGALTATLSVADIRGIQAQHIEMLALPVCRFLQEAPLQMDRDAAPHGSATAELYGIKPRRSPLVASSSPVATAASGGGGGFAAGSPGSGGPPALGGCPASPVGSGFSSGGAAWSCGSGLVGGGLVGGGLPGGSPSGGGPSGGGPSHRVLPAVTPHTTLREALRLLVDRGWHRLYVVDDCLRPVGVVTLTDVLALVTLDMMDAAELLASGSSTTTSGGGDGSMCSG